MTEPSLPTIKRLFIESGRRCAFPGCETPLVLESGEIIGEICHIRARNARGPRHDRNQSEAQRQGYDNLLLLCPTHHRVIDAQPAAYTVEVLQEMKAQAIANLDGPERPSDRIFAGGLLGKLRDVIINDNQGNIAINSPGAIQAGTLVVKSTRGTTKINPPPGSIGADGDARRYVKHLIDRYIEFAKSDTSRTGQFKPAVIYATIKREFGSQWELVSLDRFSGLCAYLQQRIAKTRLGRSNAAKGHALYSSFEAFKLKHEK